MSRKTDVLVVGSGLAGLMAALTAAREGCQVRIITRGMGSLAISGGSLDLLGYAAGQRLEDPWSGIANLPVDHPYRLLGAEKIRRALDLFCSCAAEQGWPLHTARTSQGTPINTLLPTIMGTLKPSYLLPEYLDPAVLHTARRILVGSVHGLRDCHPALIIRQLRRYKGWAEKSFLPVMLPSPLEGTHRSLNALDFARLVDKPEGQSWLLHALLRHTGQGDLLLLPPLCGSHPNAPLYRKLQSAAGCPIVELISIPPGVGGLRLRELLLRALHGHNVSLVENAHVSRAVVTEGSCTALLATGSGQESRYEAKAFVLATGGILGGGLALLPGKARECIFDLDIPVPGDVSLWSEPDIFGSHIFSRLGVRVDHTLRPLAGTTDKPCWNNVFFAGRSIGGYDFATEKSGYGVALATGWQAGRMAAHIAGETPSRGL